MCLPKCFDCYGSRTPVHWNRLVPEDLIERERGGSACPALLKALLGLSESKTVRTMNAQHLTSIRWFSRSRDMWALQPTV